MIKTRNYRVRESEVILEPYTPTEHNDDKDDIEQELGKRCITCRDGTFLLFDQSSNALSYIEVSRSPTKGSFNGTYIKTVEIKTSPPSAGIPKEITDLLESKGY